MPLSVNSLAMARSERPDLLSCFTAGRTAAAASCAFLLRAAAALGRPMAAPRSGRGHPSLTPRRFAAASPSYS